MAGKATARLRKADKDWTDEEEAKKADAAETSDDQADSKKDDDDDDKDELDKADEADEDDDDDDEEQDDDDDGEASAGEFRVRVLPNGLIRMVLSDDEDEDDDEDEGEDDEDSDSDDTESEPSDSYKSTDPARRGRVTADSLEKALAAVRKYASAADPQARRTALLRRAQGKGLSKGEARELFFSMSGQEGAAAGGSLRRRVDKAFDAKGSLAKSARDAADSLDALEFLEGFSSNMSKGLGLVAEEIEASSARDHQSKLLLFKAVAKIGQAVKAVAERMDAVASGPARAPKSLGHGTPIQKAFAGASGDGSSLSREDAADLIEEMNKSTHGTAHRGVSQGGHNLNSALDVLLTTGNIPKSLVEELSSFKAKKTKARQAS